jgi:integrase
MIFAVNTGILTANSLAGISKAFQAPTKQHLPTIKPEQLPALMQTIITASIKRTTRCLIEWQLHTMVRPSEAAGTRWDEIDFDKQLWTIPAERMKKKKEHIVPLTEQCIALLESIKPIGGHLEHVFPADRNPRTHINSSTANVALKRMGYGGELVSHGLGHWQVPF